MPATTRKPTGLKVTGLAWRDGRPRWIPSPTLRAKLWRGLDLKDARGEWASPGDAVTQATFINENVAAWRSGRPVDIALAAIAPGCGDIARADNPPLILGPSTIGRLIDDFNATARPGKKTLAQSTRDGYRTKLNALLRAVATLQGISLDQLRSLDITFFVKPRPKSGDRYWLQEAYDYLDQFSGPHLASGAIVVAKVWFTWIVKRKSMLVINPARDVDMEATKGRKVLISAAETDALVAAADWLGVPSIGDAVALGLDLSWNKQDILEIRHAQVDDQHRVRHERIKTGVEGMPRLMPAGRRRLAQIRARWEGRTLPATIIAHDETGKPWGSGNFDKHFQLVRAVACAEAGPALFDKHFQDLRDTGITNMARVPGMTLADIATRSLHSLETITRILKEHYLVLDQAMADAASDKFEAYILEQERKAVNERRHANVSRPRMRLVSPEPN